MGKPKRIKTIEGLEPFFNSYVYVNGIHKAYVDPKHKRLEFNYNECNTHIHYNYRSFFEEVAIYNTPNPSAKELLDEIIGMAGYKR